MADQQVGNIVYQVQMNVNQLLTAQRQVNDRLDRLEGGFNNTTRAVNNTEKSMLSLSGVAAALASALSIQQVAKYAEAWTVVNNKLANSIKPHEDLGDAVNRVFNLAQDTRTELDATASLYSRLERATRQAGTSTEDLARLTTIINQAFIVSGATAQEAESAIIQLSQGLASGTLRGEEYNSVNEQGNRLIVALSESLGVGAGKLREMAFAGKLTTDIVVDGLLKQGDAIGKEFANTVTTMGQAFSVATNNITKFVGESTTVKSAYNAFNSSIVTISENLDSLSTAVMAIAAVFGSRFVGALVMASAAKVKGALDAQTLARAELQTAQAAQFAANATLRKAIADKEAAISALNLAQAEYNVAKGSAAEAFALDNLNAKKSIAIAVSADLVVAENALAAATTRTAAAARAANAAWTLAKGALALIGGPTGAAFLAGAAIFYFYQRAEEAKKAAIELADGVNALIGKMQQMSRTQLLAEAAKLRSSFTQLDQALGEAKQAFNVAEAAVKRTETQLSRLAVGSDEYKKKAIELQDAQDQLNIATDDRTQAENRLGQAMNGARILTAQANGEFREGIDLLRRDGQEAGVVSGLMRKLGDAINFAGRAKDKFNATSLKIERPKDVQAYLDKQLQQIELQGELNDKKRSQLKAEQEIRALGGDEDAIKLARERAGVEFDKLKAQKDQKKETQEATKAESQAEAAEKRRAKSLQDLSNEMAVAALQAKGLSKEAAQLAAVQELGVGASPKQVELARQQAGEIFEIERQKKDRASALAMETAANLARIRDEDLAQAKRQLDANLIDEETYQQRRLAIVGEYNQKIAAASAKTAVSPIEANRGEIDPVQALANQNAQKLALMNQYYQQEQAALTAARQQNQLTEMQYQQARLAMDTQYQALITAQNTQFEQQRTDALWTMLNQQSLGYDMLTSAVDAFSGNASNALTGLITGSMSAEEAMRSLGSTMLNSVVNSLVQVGVEALKNFIIAQTIGAAGQTAAAAAATAGGAAALAAWTPAAIAASIATMGAASGTGLAAYQTAQAGGLAMSVLGGVAGARKNGGPVNAGSMYQVGEGGRPELLQAGGKQYMIPGDNGKVISNKDMQGGGFVVNNIVNNYSSAGYDTQSTVSSDGKTLTIESVIYDLNNGGTISQAITNNMNVRRTPRGQG
ncbi:tape measure protein [Serratia fonticola]